MNSVPIAEFIFSKNSTNSSSAGEVTDEALKVTDFIEKTSANYSISETSDSEISSNSYFDHFSDNESLFFSEDSSINMTDYTSEPSKESVIGNLTSNLKIDEKTAEITWIHLLAAFVIFLVMLIACSYLYRYLSHRFCCQSTEDPTTTTEVVAQYRARYPRIEEEDEEADENAEIELFKSPISDSPAKGRSQSDGFRRRNKDYVPITWDFDDRNNVEIEIAHLPPNKDTATQTSSEEESETETPDALTPEQLKKLKEECKEIEYIDE